MRVYKAVVVCDEQGCGWKQEITLPSIPEWHKKPCPVCGEGEIINDMDMDVHLLMTALVGEHKDSGHDKKIPLVGVTINTAALRCEKSD